MKCGIIRVSDSLRLKQSSGTETHHNLDNSTCDPFKYKMGNPMSFVKIHQNRKG